MRGNFIESIMAIAIGVVVAGLGIGFYAWASHAPAPSTAITVVAALQAAVMAGTLGLILGTRALDRREADAREILEAGQRMGTDDERMAGLAPLLKALDESVGWEGAAMVTAGRDPDGLTPARIARR